MFGRSQSMPGTETMLTKPVEKQHTDTVVNFLIRIACQVTPPPWPPLHTHTHITLNLSDTHTKCSSAIHSACQVGHIYPNPFAVKVGHTWWLSWTHLYTLSHTDTHTVLPVSPHTAVPRSGGSDDLGHKLEIDCWDFAHLDFFLLFCFLGPSSILTVHPSISVEYNPL